jgi:hypothetical protein
MNRLAPPLLFHAGGGWLGERQLILQRGFRIQLTPQFEQCFGQPAPHGAGPMQPHMTGDTERDQGRFGIFAGAVMDDEPPRLATSPTAPIALEHGFPQPTKSAPGMIVLLIAETAKAQSWQFNPPPSAGAKQGQLSNWLFLRQLFNHRY